VSRKRSSVRFVPTLALGAAAYGLAFPPFDYAACAWVALVPLLLAVRGAGTRRAFVLGLSAGFLSAWAVSWWLAGALARYFDLGWTLGIAGAGVYALVVWGMPFGLFAAAAASLLRTPRPLQPVACCIGVGALWVATELLRGRVMQQPWALLGYSQHAHVELAQLAAVTAVYGLSFVICLGNWAIAEAIVRFRSGDRRAAVHPLVGVAVVVALVWFAGDLRVRSGAMGGFEPQPVAIVQAGTRPARVWTRAFVDRQILAHVRLTTTQLRDTPAALIVWPEHAVPAYPDRDPALRHLLGEVARRHRADLLFGAPRSAGGTVYNSVRLVDPSGHERGHYDKQRPVLLAESNPFAPADALADDGNPARFGAGAEATVLSSFVKLAPSVCHEVLFPELVRAAVAADAALLVNVSNDAWLDDGAGVASRQHFAMARFRAIETDRYLVRAATTGVSGVIDPRGRILETAPLGAAAVLVATVPGRHGRTPYVLLGDSFAFACALLAAVTLVEARRRSAA